MKIYVASSWRNKYQPDVVAALRNNGHDVYDFHNPCAGAGGFHWSQIDRHWQSWSTQEYIHGLSHPLAKAAFVQDFAAMEWADACILVLPCGRSAHLEAGYFVGARKPLLILVERIEPELMYKMADGIYPGAERLTVQGRADIAPLLLRLKELEYPSELEKTCRPP